MIRKLTIIPFLLLLFKTGLPQYNWKQVKQADGITVYQSDVTNSKYGAVKLECTLPGTYLQLMNILQDVENSSDWVYNSISNRILKKYSSSDYIYYTETHLPWPMQNRDVIIHMRFNMDSLPALLIITGTSEAGYVPEKPGKVRVEQYFAEWRVTMLTPQSMRVQYIVRVDPGGSLPAWASNMFITKGPFETFKNLAAKLSK